MPPARNERETREIALIAARFKAISHPLRLAIICLLADGECCVGTICERLGSSQPNISQHLAALSNGKLLVARKDANRVFYRLADPDIVRLIAAIRAIYCH